MQFVQAPDEEGCFVFRVVNNNIIVRSRPSIEAEDRTELEFEVGELVVIDRIQYSKDKNNGPYLRLADCAGWVFLKCMGQERMQYVPVERGIREIYVDNFPNGQYLRRHPVTSSDLDYEVGGEAVLYHPGTKLFSDMSVLHPLSGIRYYRVQGTTGWLFDHVPNVDGETPERVMLLEKGHIRTGTFCYQALRDVHIRTKPDAGEDSKSKEIIKEGEIVSVNYLRQHPFNDDNGDFLRLSDGAGWLCEKEQDNMVMKNLPLLTGSWILKVLNPPVGVALRRHPVVCQSKQYPTMYPDGTVIQCDHKVAGQDGMNFYRVLGTSGWVLDRKEDNKLLELISAGSDLTVTMHNPWEPNFVRGIAATIDDIEEKKQFTENGLCILTFERHMDGIATASIYVSCKSRTVAVCTEGTCHRNEHDCSTKSLIRLLNWNPATNITEKTQSPRFVDADLDHTKLYTKKSSESPENSILDDSSLAVMSNSSNSNSASDEDQATVKAANMQTEDTKFIEDALDSDLVEYELRRQLIALDKEEEATRARKKDILLKLMKIDEARGAEISEFMQMTEERLLEMKESDSENGGDHAQRAREDVICSPIDENNEDTSLGMESLSVTFLGKMMSSAPRAPKSERSSKSSKSSRRRDYQCGECRLVFSTKEDRLDHCRFLHGIECEECGEAFKSFRLLDDHKDHTGHWGEEEEEEEV